MLLEETARLEEEFPIPREFVTRLCTAYQFAVDRAVYRNPDGSERTECSFRIEQDAQFEGQEFVFRLAARGPAVKPSKGAERALSWSFADYRVLLRLAEKGPWNEGKLNKAGKILDFYMIGNFQDKNIPPSFRHPAGMRLINHFFQREKLPRELYRMAWQKLDLKTAIMGRAKLLYGDLRARVLEQVPDIAENELNILQLNKDFEQFRQKVRALEETGRPEDWEKAGAETRAFFNHPDFQRALWDRKFADDHMKYHVQWSGEHFAQAVLEFYEQHPDAPCAAQLSQLIAQSRHRREINLRNRQDQEAEIPERLTLKDRSLFRHWLNTDFSHSMERAPDADTFFFLLPITAAVYDQYEAVREEIFRRLPDTAAPEEGRAFIAACIADQICGLPIPNAVGMEDAQEPEWVQGLPPESFLPYQICAENTEILCIWFQRDRVLALFQQTPFGQKLEELLTLFSTGRVDRLEWSWKCAFPADEPPMDYEPRRSLVLLKDGRGYVCLYFDDLCAKSYALLEKPVKPRPYEILWAELVGDDS